MSEESLVLGLGEKCRTLKYFKVRGAGRATEEKCCQKDGVLLFIICSVPPLSAIFSRQIKATKPFSSKLDNT